MNYKILLLRHGESQWNLENRFTGWIDVDLTKKGQIEAREAGLLLKESQFKFDLVYSCPQYIFVSGGSFLNLFKELNISSWVPSKTLPHPNENKVSPVKTTFSLKKKNATWPLV